jgi:hypothetical protein
VQPPLDDDAGAARQGLGDMIRHLSPDRAAQEQGVGILPLVALPVEGAGRGGDGEVRDHVAGRGEADFGVIGQVADDGDDGLVYHEVQLLT